MTNPRRAAQPVTQLSEHLDLTKASEYPGLLAIHLAVALAMMLATFSLIGLTTDPSFGSVRLPSSSSSKSSACCADTTTGTTPRYKACKPFSSSSSS